MQNDMLERRGAAERYHCERAVTVVVAAFAVLKTARKYAMIKLVD